jgi:hypothetical protein
MHRHHRGRQAVGSGRAGGRRGDPQPARSGSTHRRGRPGRDGAGGGSGWGGGIGGSGWGGGIVGCPVGGGPGRGRRQPRGRAPRRAVRSVLGAPAAGRAAGAETARQPAPRLPGPDAGWPDGVPVADPHERRSSPGSRPGSGRVRVRARRPAQCVQAGRRVVQTGRRRDCGRGGRLQRPEGGIGSGDVSRSLWPAAVQAQHRCRMRDQGESAGQVVSAAPGNVQWVAQESIDLDMVSAICPNCHILLVEANTNGLGDLGGVPGHAGLGFGGGPDAHLLRDRAPGRPVHRPRQRSITGTLTGAASTSTVTVTATDGTGAKAP